MENKKGQVTIFIIVAIVLISAVAGFFVFRGNFSSTKIPPSVEPVYTTFISCLKDDTSTGISVLESQAGYISLPSFVPGSSYMPFSSQLDFLGNPVPYWYYVSGNNIPKEQVPSVEMMESQLSEFIQNKIKKCVFDKYYEEGFLIQEGKPKAKVRIKDNSVSVDLDMNLAVDKGGEHVAIKNHHIEVDSKLGKLYNDAIKIYQKEQKDLFLEKYAVDNLRLYAPVDGVKLTCSPLIWSANKVFDKLENAIEENTDTLRVKGRSHFLGKENNKYFIIDIPVDSNVQFLNSKNWSHNFEVAPSEGSIMMAKPIGNQPGLGILGFCYVPYHFVYNVGYPVLIQVSDGDEIFQFPVAVVLRGNIPRKAFDVSAINVEDPEICNYKNNQIRVGTYDMHSNPINANLSYECFENICDIGQTKDGVFNGNFPQCVNGYILAKAKGFKTARLLYSSINKGNVNIFLDRLYPLKINLKLGGEDFNGSAVIDFISNSSSKTILYPGIKDVELSAGQYEIQVYVYKNSSIKLEKSSMEQCMNVPQEGVGGLFGLTKKKCFNVDVPAQVISNALAGGGKEKYYIAESQLENAKTIEISAGSLPLPNSLQQLQENYELFNGKGLDINIK